MPFLDENGLSRLWINIVARLNGRMASENPEGTGSFSMNRKADTPIGPNSSTFGVDCTASAALSFAEGQDTVASGALSHAEGFSTIAAGDVAHAEGMDTRATGEAAHTEGKHTEAAGNYSHAEGYDTIAAGVCAHAEGYESKATKDYAHAEGYHTSAKALYAHTEGYGTSAYGEASHAEGNQTEARGNCSHAEGCGLYDESGAAVIFTVAIGEAAHAEGAGCVASGGVSHAEGRCTTASGSFSHAEGYGAAVVPNTITNESTNDNIIAAYNAAASYEKFALAKGTASHSEGQNCLALGNYTHAEGNGNIAAGVAAHVEGRYNVANGVCSHAEGGYTIAGNYQHTSGKYNVEKDGPSSTSTQDTTNADAVFIVGCGTSSARKNAFRISSGGKCFGTAAFGATGADFAELFEWVDGNPNNEDRRGLFVTLDGEKIRIANAGDDYIGVISGAQAFIGNSASEEWHEKYLTDVFGTKLSKEVEIPAVINEETGDVITPATTTTQYVLNPEYNPDEEYVMRENRKEWGIVGLLGQIVMIDDGTCVVGGRVAPSANGIGTAANDGYRVMKRIDENHIKVLVK